MDSDSNMARRLRAIIEELHEYAERYDETGQLNARDQINDAADAVGELHRLPDADEDGPDAEPVE